MSLIQWRWGTLPISWRPTPYRALPQHHGNYDRTFRHSGALTSSNNLEPVGFPSRSYEVHYSSIQVQLAERLSLSLTSPAPSALRTQQVSRPLLSTPSSNQPRYNSTTLRLEHFLPHHPSKSLTTQLRPPNPHLRPFHHRSAHCPASSLAFYKSLSLLYEQIKHQSSLFDFRHRPLAA